MKQLATGEYDLSKNELKEELLYSLESFLTSLFDEKITWWTKVYAIELLGEVPSRNKTANAIIEDVLFFFLSHNKALMRETALEAFNQHFDLLSERAEKKIKDMALNDPNSAIKETAYSVLDNFKD